MVMETVGCPHCGEQTKIPVQDDKRITEIKKERSFFDALLAFQGIKIMTVECSNAHEFCIYQE